MEQEIKRTKEMVERLFILNVSLGLVTVALLGFIFMEIKNLL